jgi:DNA-binding response OmpR family regulator
VSIHPRVLVVEDDSATREFYRHQLRFEGYDVLMAPDGVEALRLIETHGFEAVVLDLDLPRLNGLVIHQELQSKRATCYIPVVVVTGTEWDVPFPATAVLRKPITADRLIDALRLAMRRDPIQPA